VGVFARLFGDSDEVVVFGHRRKVSMREEAFATEVGRRRDGRR
jgi:hypothetical protein